MKNGKLFGKLNIIDLIVVLVVIILAVFLVSRFTGKNKTEASYQDITYTVVVEAMSRDMYDDISQWIGEEPTIVSKGGYASGHVVGLTSAPVTVDGIYKYNSNDEYTRLLIDADREYVRATFTLTATVNANSLLTEVGSQEVRTGRSHIVKTKYFEITGVIETVERPAAA